MVYPKYELRKLKRRVASTMFFKCHTMWTGRILFIFLILIVAGERINDGKFCCGKKNGFENSFVYPRCSPTVKFFMQKIHKEDHTSSCMHPELSDEYSATPRAYFTYDSALFFCAMTSCFLPVYLWVKLEDGHFEKILRKAAFLRKYGIDTNKEILAEGIFQQWNKNNLYALKLFFCEAVSSLNIMCHFCFTLHTCRGNFHFVGSYLGELTCGSDNPNHYQAMDSPSLGICIMKETELPTTSEGCLFCQFPNHELLTQMFIILHFWYSVLALLSVYNLFTWVVMMYIPTCRIFLFCRYDHFSVFSTMMKVAHEGDIGNWLILSNLRWYMSPAEFAKLIKAISEKIKSDRH